MPENIHALREFCRQCFYVVDMVSDIKRKIIALSDQVFPEYEKLFSDTFGVTSMELLTNYQTPEQILEVDSTTLAAVIFSEIGGDISKFESVPKLVAYARLYPKNQQSGESINSKGHLSKLGSPYLRRAVWLAAFVSSSKDHDFMNVNDPKVKNT